MVQETSKIYGLVLAGGKSSRMGSDKGVLEYHHVPQREYLYALLEKVCDKSYLSIRKEQEEGLTKDFNRIIDQNEFEGPFNGILSAHRLYPKAAWLVLACDLPLINLTTLQELVKSRDKGKLATSLATKKTVLPEPLITLWEPAGLEKAIEFLNSPESGGPRKFLMNSDIALIHPERDEVLYNANSLEDYEYVKSKITIPHGE